MIRIRALLALALSAGAAAITQAQPANDNCANAIPIVPTTAGIMVSGTTLGAATDGATSCGASTSPDVWYTFTLDQARYVQATLQCRGLVGHGDLDPLGLPRHRGQLRGVQR